MRAIRLHLSTLSQSRWLDFFRVAKRQKNNPFAMSSPPPEYGNKGVPYGQQPQQNYYPPPGQQGYNQPQQQGYYPPPQQQQPQTGFAPVVQSQPGQGVALTQMTSGIPPGLEYLSQLSSVNIYQVLHIEESKYAPPPLRHAPPPPPVALVCIEKGASSRCC